MFDRFKTAPVPGDIWALHRTLATDAAHNAAPELIANPDEINVCVHGVGIACGRIEGAGLRCRAA